MNGVGAVRKQQEVSAERGQESGLWGCGAVGQEADLGRAMNQHQI